MIEIKAFSKLEKFQCLRNQSEVPGYGLKTPEWNRKAPRSNQSNPSNKCKDVSLETMREKNRLISQDDSNATKDTIKKIPENE